MKTEINITKVQFAQYRAIQDLGAYNMFDPRARKMTSLSREQWIEIIKNFAELIGRYEKK